jgi:tetratricopeptide (TPR) repeat protein
LNICREYLPETHAYHPWLSGCLGLAHSKLGQYEEARICLEKSAALFAGNRVYYAWAIRCLGAVYGELGNYEKSISLLQESLEISEKSYGKDHLECAFILTSLARVYLLKNQPDTAQNMIDKAAKILEENKHPELHVSLEILADIYLKKSLLSHHQGDKHSSQRFKKKAMDALHKALGVVNTYFQENIVHKNRILRKLELQEEDLPPES